MNWALLGDSLAGVLALAGIAWLLGLGGGRIDDAEAAMRIAEDHLSGFTAREAVLSVDGDAAVVRGEGDAALLRQKGARVVVRRVPLPLSLTPADGAMLVATGERDFAPIRVAEGDKLLTWV